VAVSLFTAQHMKEQRRLHGVRRYGAASKKWADRVAGLIAERRPVSILDYGAGKGCLGRSLGTALDGRVFVEYDPGVKEIAKRPRGKFDMVCCIDVLEHIEPECLGEVLASLRELTAGFAFLTIHTGPSGKFLSDGRNSHLIQRPVGWWLEQLGMFKVIETGRVAMTHWVVCE
jgi:hypothetical protein